MKIGQALYRPIYIRLCVPFGIPMQKLANYKCMLSCSVCITIDRPDAWISYIQYRKRLEVQTNNSNCCLAVDLYFTLFIAKVKNMLQQYMLLQQ
jgi:hypothetical protein